MQCNLLASNTKETFYYNRSHGHMKYFASKESYEYNKDSNELFTSTNQSNNPEGWHLII